jgi:hypothetical protein
MLSGAGVIAADGGNGDGGFGGGGGGGRVALFYEQADGFSFTNVQAAGGLANRQGAPGTVYLQASSAADGELIVDGRDGSPSPPALTPLFSLSGGVSTTLAANALIDADAQFSASALVGLELSPDATGMQTFTIIANDANALSTDPGDGNMADEAVSGDTYEAPLIVGKLTIRNRATVEIADGDENRAVRRARLFATDIEITGQSVLTHPAGTTRSSFGLEIDVEGTLTIDATSAIDATGRGFPSGVTIEDLQPSVGASGGSYGGLGGIFSGTPNDVYGDARDPNEPGSGGGGGAGGGVLRIRGGALTVNGVIRATGGTAGNGGSGGAIKLEIETLSGSGRIEANGGGGDGGFGAGGGGGRVAIFGDTSGFTPSNVTTLGGAANRFGEAGTVVIESQP